MIGYGICHKIYKIPDIRYKYIINVSHMVFFVTPNVLYTAENQIMGHFQTLEIH